MLNSYFNNYVITMDKSVERQSNVKKEFERYNLTPCFVKAVVGNEILEKDLKKICNNKYLSKKEVGCALSHLSVYKKIINNNEKYAFIFEDDIKFTKIFDINTIKEIENFMLAQRTATVLLLHKNKRRLFKIHDINKDISIHSLFRGVSAYAYILNNEAAKSILESQTPINFEIDLWKFHTINKKIQLLCLNKNLVECDEVFYSTIGQKQDRASGNKEYKKFKKKYFKKIKNKKLKYFLKMDVLTLIFRVKNLFMSRFEK